MPKFENGIFGFVNQDEWLDVGFQVTRPGDPIDGLFGDERTDNLVARWQTIAAEYQVPMMAKFHAFDTEAQTTFRVPVDTHNIEKGLIKVKINQSERLRALTRAGVRQDDLYEYVLGDGVRLADQVFTRSKVAKNELLATGQITIKENNLDLTVDYGVPAAQKSLVLDFGTGAAATIPDQIQAIVDQATDAGVTLNAMVLSRKILAKLRQNVDIQRAIYGTAGAGMLVRNADLENYFADEFGITQIITNDLKYGADYTMSNDRPSITQARYFPDTKVSFVATNNSGRIGVGLWGDPPETDAARFMEVAASDRPYVYITQWAENDPAVTWTKASGLFIPVLYNPSSLWIATCKSTSAGA